MDIQLINILMAIVISEAEAKSRDQDWVIESAVSESGMTALAGMRQESWAQEDLSRWFTKSFRERMVRTWAICINTVELSVISENRLAVTLKEHSDVFLADTAKIIDLLNKYEWSAKRLCFDLFWDVNELWAKVIKGIKVLKDERSIPVREASAYLWAGSRA